MNQRFKEFIKQASTIEVISGRGFDETQYIDRFDKEKFAELIVRECARIADRKYLYSKEPNRWDSGFNISCEILEQFGILKDE
jgi:hypothetical protein